jgi:ABC-2 type transport system ATP-binding protein
VVCLEVEGDPEPLLPEIKAAPWIKTHDRHDGTLNLTMEKGERRIPELVMMAQRRGVTVASVQLRRPSLEDVFLHFTGRTIREQEAGADERNRARIPGRGMGRRR